MRSLALLPLVIAAAAGAPAAAQQAPAPVAAPADAPSPMLPSATEVRRWTAPEAHQGVAVDKGYFYAISNDEIGKYDKRTGQRVAHWQGERRLYPHMNSCLVDGTLLVCAASNYRAVPMASAVEFFDTRTLRHVRSVSLPPIPGSLTWIERRGRDWYAAFANYDDPKRGGEPGHDHRWTLLVRMDDQFRPTGSWHFPDAVLARFAPMSCSGGSWGDDGLLYVTGHDRPELYALRLPEAGTVLELVATIPILTDGQAFAWDRSAKRTLWSIERKSKAIFVSTIPAVSAQP
jgi:hypothetical protein